MLARCKQCQGDIVVDTIPDSAKGNCPICGKEFAIIVNKQGNIVKLLFAEDDKGAERRCVKCGRSFRDSGAAAVPVCDDCRSSEIELDTTGNQWTVFRRDGRVFGPTSLSELQELADKGFFSRDDHVSGPGQSRVSIAQCEDFAEFFAATQPKQVSKSPRRRGQLKRFWYAKLTRRLLIFSIVIIFAYLLVYINPLKFAKERQKPTSHEMAAYGRVWQQIQQESRSDLLPADQKTMVAAVQKSIKRVQQAMAADRFESYLEAERELKQALVIDKDSMVVAGLLGEAEAYISAQKRDLELKQQALVLAAAAKQRLPAAPYGYRAQVATLIGAANYQAALRVSREAMAKHQQIGNDARMQMYRSIARIGLNSELIKTIGELRALPATTQPQLREALNWLAQAYLQQGDLYAALQALKRRQALDADHPRTLTQMGFLQELTGKVKRAAQLYQQALRHHPAYIEARLRLSFLYYQELDEPDSAARNLREIIERYSSIATEAEKRYAFYHLCSIHLQQKDLVAATTNCNAALKISPYFVPLLLKRVQLLNIKKQHSQALELLQRAQLLQPDSLPVLVTLSRTHQQLGDNVAAIRLMSEQVERFPESLALLLELASLYTKQAQQEAAESVLRQGLANVWLDYPESQYRDRWNRIDFAAYPATEVAKLWAESKPLAAPFSVAAAAIYLVRGKLSEAERLLQQATKQQGFVPAYLFLAEILNRRNQAEQAAALLAANSSFASLSLFGKLVFLEALSLANQIERTEQLLHTLPELAGKAGCRRSLIQMRVDLRRNQPLKQRDALFRCAAAPLHYYPALTEVFSGKFSQSG